MYVQWSPLFEIGVPALDDQHRQLAERINDLHAAHGTAADPLGRGVFPILNGLVRYAEEHFRDEERLMASARYPGLARQRREHEAFLGRVFALAERLERGDAELSDDLFAFLRGWLLDHILGEDRKLAGFLGDREARSGPPEAR
ncbi:MAG: bacteriohemerythrin [Deferrisomatales bacterium]